VVGARQAVGLKLVGSGRRGLAASLNAISMQVPRAIGPVIGGWLLEANLLALPFSVAAALQAGYLARTGEIAKHVATLPPGIVPGAL
jgi:MFS family permease